MGLEGLKQTLGVEDGLGVQALLKALLNRHLHRILCAKMA
jgi:hypothetical protein